MVLKVTIKLATALSAYRPAGATRNTFELEVVEPASVGDILSLLGISTEQSVMVIINDTLITPDQRPAFTVRPGDKLAIMTPIHAG